MNPDDKYYNVSVGEGIDLLKEDIKDIAIDSKESVEDLIAQYIESTKMEEGELGKLPPLPTSWASGILRALKPVKGLYDAEKKNALAVSLFKTVAGDSSRRGFLKTIVGNSDKLRTKRILKKMTEDSKNYKSKFKWADAGPGSKFYKKLEEIINPKSPKGILKKAKAEKKTFHAEGGLITVSDPGMGDGPFMMEEFLEAVKQGFKGTYDEYIDQIDRSPRDYLAEGGPTQKEIDKELKAIEKLKPSLMPESYEALIEIYKDKQKDLNIDIMESAGGLGEMLGEGGRAGFAKGNGKFKSNGHGKNFEVGYPGTIPINPTTGKSMISDTGVVSGIGAAIAAPFLLWYVKKKKKEANQKAYAAGEDLPYPLTGRGPEEKAEGGRIGMMYGGDPGFAFSYGGSWADWKDNHASEMPLMDYINQKLPKARHPFSDAKYANGGPVFDIHLFNQLVAEGMSEEEAYATAGGQAQFDSVFKPDKKAEGGRIGLANGTTMDAFESMTPNRKYMMTGESDVHRIQPPMGGILPLAGAGIFALSQKDKDKKKQPPQKKKGPNYPEPTPPFKPSDAIIDFILLNRRQPKPSEELRLKEIIRVAKEKAEGITSLFNENLHGLNTQRFVESAQDTSQKLLEDLVDVEEHNWDPKMGKSTSTWKTYKRSDKDRPPTPEELEDDYGELWNDEQSPLDFGSTIAELDAALEEQRAYERYMYDQYKTGKLDKYMSMDAKLERVLDADSAGRPSGYSSDEEYEIRAYGDEKERLEIAKMNAAEEKAKAIASGSPWYTDPTTLTPEDELRKEFPGIDDNLIKNILADKDPANVAKVKEALTKALDMTMQGKKPEGIIKTLKKQYPKKKAEGGIIETDEFKEYLEDRKKRDQDRFKQDFFEDFKKWKKWKEGNIIEVKDGGRIWRPKSAPKLTTTIPPERGPTPQGLTYLTGDDIVQNIG